MVDTVIQTTGTAEFEDGLRSIGNQFEARNSFHWVYTIPEINAIIDFRGGVDQVLLESGKCPTY